MQRGIRDARPRFARAHQQLAGKARHARDFDERRSFVSLLDEEYARLPSDAERARFLANHRSHVKRGKYSRPHGVKIRTQLDWWREWRAGCTGARAKEESNVV